MLHQLFRRGKSTPAKSFREALLHAVIGHWPHIRPAEIKEQKHFYSPATDTANLRKTSDDFVIAHSDKSTSGWHGAVNRLRCEIFYSGSFGARKTGGAEFLVRCGKNLRRIEPFCFSIKGADPPPDCCRGFPA